MELEAGKEGLAGDFDIDLESEELHCVVSETEGVFARAGLYGVVGDIVLENAGVAGFIVSNLSDTFIGGVGETEFGKGGCVESLDCLLVEGVDDPFSCK